MFQKFINYWILFILLASARKILVFLLKISLDQDSITFFFLNYFLGLFEKKTSRFVPAPPSYSESECSHSSSGSNDSDYSHQSHRNNKLCMSIEAKERTRNFKARFEETHSNRSIAQHFGSFYLRMGAVGNLLETICLWQK